MLMSFKEALQSSNGSERTVLLGNGFSIASSSVFDYRNLYQMAQIDAKLQNIFTAMETFDFEIIIRHLEQARELLEIYSKEYPALINELKSSSDSLRSNLARVLSLKHADYPIVFSQKNNVDNPVRTCFEFLSHFKKIFTTNYDLLLYWAINLNNEKFYKEKNIKIPSDDGFGRMYENLVWLGDHGDRKQEIFFLHGALFLYQEDGILMKMERNPEDNLLQIVSENITHHNEFPLIVLECVFWPN